ncbi:hypothetical protein AB0M95_38595 [Sphaerisporangium sp. NPDC051017]|uniref:hypothetical protein n=1 Tax=Sphaerisporangium sp. NPDC051017 TaxID=3154636 RepID=UPI003433F1A6
MTPKPTTTYTPLATVSAGSAMPLPTMTATLVPTAVGTFTVKPGKFNLKVGTTGATYSCAPATPATPASATALPLTVVVASPSASASNTPSTTPSDTPTPTPTPTPTTTSPKPTHTVYETVTKKPTDQVTKKPAGGAATGGGGDAGPDGRVLVAVGMVLVVGAGMGGLVIRRRRPNRG